jgi:uncharacterized membrane protein YhhN
MWHLVPILLLICTVVPTVQSRLWGKPRLEYIFKPISTLLVIAVALLSLLQPDAQPAYTLGITLGLVLSLGGDLALMFRNSNRWFLIGLVLFFLAHIAYAVVLSVANGFHAADLAWAAVLIILGCLVYVYLKPGLGKMGLPVALYVLVIGFMVNRAISTHYGTSFNPVQAWLLTAGAVLFMVSDLMLATNRYRRPFRLESTSLYFYYAGQLLIALSASYF